MSAARQAGLNPTVKVAGPSNIGNYLAGLGIPATAGFGVAYRGLHATDEQADLASIPAVRDLPPGPPRPATRTVRAAAFRGFVGSGKQADRQSSAKRCAGRFRYRWVIIVRERVAGIPSTEPGSAEVTPAQLDELRRADPVLAGQAAAMGVTFRCMQKVWRVGSLFAYHAIYIASYAKGFRASAAAAAAVQVAG